MHNVLLDDVRFDLISSLSVYFDPVAIKEIKPGQFYIKPYTSKGLEYEIDNTIKHILKELPYKMEKKERDPFFMEDGDLHPEYLLTRETESFFLGEKLSKDELMDRMVVDYFLQTFEKLAMKYMASGEFYIKGYHPTLSPEEIDSKVRKDLESLPILIETYELEPYFINDLDLSPEFMITFLDD